MQEVCCCQRCGFKTGCESVFTNNFDVNTSLVLIILHVGGTLRDGEISTFSHVKDERVGE